jgi:hypothetical protein
MLRDMAGHAVYGCALSDVDRTAPRPALIVAGIEELFFG